MAKTGRSGFHFVDEAAPPALMRELALEIIKREKEQKAESLNIYSNF